MLKILFSVNFFSLSTDFHVDGLPQVVVSDQGREFNNQLDTQMMTLLGINRRLTTAYHPQVM